MKAISHFNGGIRVRASRNISDTTKIPERKSARGRNEGTAKDESTNNKMTLSWFRSFARFVLPSLFPLCCFSNLLVPLFLFYASCCSFSSFTLYWMENRQQQRSDKDWRQTCLLRKDRNKSCFPGGMGPSWLGCSLKHRQREREIGTIWVYERTQQSVGGKHRQNENERAECADQQPRITERRAQVKERKERNNVNKANHDDATGAASPAASGSLIPKANSWLSSKYSIAIKQCSSELRAAALLW